MKRFWSLLLVVCAMSLAACKGGSSSTLTPPIEPASSSNSAIHGELTGGEPASVEVVLIGYPVTGHAGKFTVLVYAKDSSGQRIRGPFPSPLMISDSDTTGAVTISPTSLVSGSSGATLTYSGAALSKPVTVGASMAGDPKMIVAPLSFLPDSSDPFVNGATVTYNTSATTTTTDAGRAPTKSTVTGSYTLGVNTGVTWNGIPNLVDEHAAYSGSSAEPDQTSDVYLQVVSSSAGAKIYEVGSNDGWSSGSTCWFFKHKGFCAAGASRTDQFALPGQIIDELPHAAGNAWPLEGSTYSGDAYNHSIIFSSEMTFSGLPDGYTSFSTSPNGNKGIINANGTASLTHALKEATRCLGQSILIGIPAARGDAIPVTTSQLDAQCNPTGPATQASVPNWYPGGLAFPLYRQSEKDDGSTSIPATCGINPPIASPAEVLIELYEAVRPLNTPSFGYTPNGDNSSTTAQQTDQYVVPGVGLVCAIRTTTAQTYNIMTGALESSKNSTVTIALSSGSMEALARRHAAAYRRGGGTNVTYELGLGAAVSPVSPALPQVTR